MNDTPDGPAVVLRNRFAWPRRAGTGVMLTGSHNPPDYNGLKMVIGENTLASDEIQDLRKRIESGDFATGKGVKQEKDILDAYSRHGFYVFEKVLGEAERADLERDLHDMLERAPSTNEPRSEVWYCR